LSAGAFASRLLKPLRSGARHVFCAAWLLAAGTAAMAAPAALSPSVFNDSLPVDTAVLGTRIPVVLVHGLGGSNDGWDAFLRAYAQEPGWRSAFKPYSFRYNTTNAEVAADPAGPRSISGIGAALRVALQAYYDRPALAPDFGFGGKPIIILAHSMGGLVARSMMQEQVFNDGQRGGQKVLHLITLGTPHQGSPLADAALAFGLQTVSELTDTYPGFLADLAWTNYDALNMAGGRCNGWLSQLNNYAPAGGGAYGRCGFVPANSLPGFYDRIIAYGARELQAPDVPSGNVGSYKPGSAPSLLITYGYLYGALSRSYANDGIVPLASAQFAGPALWQRAEAVDCDHRFIKRGYPEFVRTPAATYSDWAFCSANASGSTQPSAHAGGYAVTGSIFGAPGGVVDTIKTVSEAERVLAWGEQAYAGYLQPAGARTDIHGGYYFRHYPQTGAYVGVKDGNVYYQGPASGQEVVFISTLADFLARAEADGF